MPEMLNEWVGFLYRSIVDNMNGMNLFFACLAGLVGSKRGRSFWSGFLLALVVSWLPAMLIMSVLPPKVGPRRSQTEGLEDARREQRRIAEAERRAQQRPAASPAPAEPPRGKAALDRTADSAPQSSRPALPQPAALPLPSDLHPDPLSDAPRVTLRSEGRSATRPGPRSTEAEPTPAAPAEAAPTDPRTAVQVATTDGSDTAAVGDPAGPPPRKTTRPEALGADASS
jgi:uncharacterized membrane protein YeaQ/YmgE (transglycosylase-associated protein family)